MLGLFSIKNIREGRAKLRAARRRARFYHLSRLMPAGRRQNSLSTLGDLGDLEYLNRMATNQNITSNDIAVSRYRQLLESGAEIFSFDRADDFSDSHFDFVVRSKLEPFSPFSRSIDDPLSDIASFTVSAARVCARHGRTLVMPHCYEPEEERSFFYDKILSFHTIGKRRGQLHFKGGDLKNLIILDDAGYSGWSSLASDSGLAQLQDVKPDMAWLQRHVSEILDSNISKYAQAPRNAEEQVLPEDFVFVALQKMNDRTQEHAFIEMLTMLDMIVDRFSGSNIKVVVKPHPKCKSAATREKLRSLQGRIIVSNLSIHEILPRCRALFTVNSGVGSEALIYNLPIYTFGLSEYRWCVHEVRSVEELKAKTKDLLPAASIEENQRFLYYYRRIKQVDVRDTKEMESRIESVFVRSSL